MNRSARQREGHAFARAYFTCLFLLGCFLGAMITRPSLSPLNVAISSVIGGLIFVAIPLFPIVKHHIRRLL